MGDWMGKYNYDGLHCTRCGERVYGWGKCPCWAVDMQDGIPLEGENIVDQIDHLVEDCWPDDLLQLKCETCGRRFRLADDWRIHVVTCEGGLCE